jgi:hypothetical protein
VYSAEAGRPQREIALLGQACGAPRGPQVRLAGGRRFAGQFQQVAADGVDRWVRAIRSSVSSVPISARPASGPSAIATATARLSVTTGPGATRSSTW